VLVDAPDFSPSEVERRPAVIAIGREGDATNVHRCRQDTPPFGAENAQPDCCFLGVWSVKNSEKDINAAMGIMGSRRRSCKAL